MTQQPEIDDAYRVIGRVVKAANEAGIDVERAFRFLALLTFNTKADEAHAHGVPERTQ